MSRKIYLTKKTYTKELLRMYPDRIFLYGDNIIHKGKAGQAVIRDEPNAYGIPTKKYPALNKQSFFTDDEFEENQKVIKEAFDKLPKDKDIVIPKAGIGTGLAQLKYKAPKTYEYLKFKIQQLMKKKEG